MKRILLAVAATIGFAGSAAACINDMELPKHEREFRSQYRDEPASPGEATSQPSSSPSDWLLIGTGAVLLGGAVGLTVTRIGAAK